MKRIKNMNGYAIYQAGARDVDKCGAEEGTFYVYFSSDIRDYGLTNSEPEFEGLDTLEAAEGCCTGNYAKAREIVEGRTTAASFEEIAAVEAQLDAGTIDEDGEPIIDGRRDHDAETASSKPARLKGVSTMSFYSNKLEGINEAQILENIGIGASLTGSHSMIDDVFVAWQFTNDFRKTEISPYMAEAEQETTEALTAAFGPLETESILSQVEDPAVQQGFALGVQFVLAAMKNDGAIWKLLTQPGAADGKELQL